MAGFVVEIHFAEREITLILRENQMCPARFTLGIARHAVIDRRADAQIANRLCTHNRTQSSDGIARRAVDSAFGQLGTDHESGINQILRGFRLIKLVCHIAHSGHHGYTILKQRLIPIGLIEAHALRAINHVDALGVAHEPARIFAVDGKDLGRDAGSANMSQAIEIELPANRHRAEDRAFVANATVDRGDKIGFVVEENFSRLLGLRFRDLGIFRNRFAELASDTLTGFLSR